MVKVILQNDTVRFEMLGWDRVWTFKSRLEIPFSCIRRAQAHPEVAGGGWKGWRIPGTQIPGIITAGTYYKKGHRTFWDVRNPEKALVIDLTNHKYDQIIVEVEDPTGEARKIEEMLIK